VTDIAAFSPPLIGRSALRALAASGDARARHYRIDEFGSIPPYLAGTRLSIYSAPGDCEKIWRDAVERCAGTLFQCFEWHAAFHATIGVAEGVEPQIVHLADRAGRTLLLLPLAIYREGRLRVLRFSGGVVTDYNAPLIDRTFAARTNAAQVARLWAIVLDLLPRVDLVWLRRMPAALEEVPNPFAALPGAEHTENAHPVMLPETVAAFRAGRKAKFVRENRRLRRRMGELGAVEFRCPAPGSTEAEAAFAAIARQKSRLWVETRCRDLFAEPGYLDFYRSLTHADFQSARPHLSALHVGGTIVSAGWGMVFRGRYYFLVVGREDGAWTRWSPGRLLFESLIETSIADPEIGIFDLAAGDESYKREWTDTKLPLYELLATRTGKGALFLLRHRLRERLKRNRHLRNWVRRLRGKKPK